MGNQQEVLFTKKDIVHDTGTHLLLAVLRTGRINFLNSIQDASQAAVKTIRATLTAVLQAILIHKFTIVGFGCQQLSFSNVRKGLNR